MRIPGAEPRKRGQSRQVRPGQGLLQPQDVERGEPGGHLAGRDRVERARRVAGHPPALVEVDHDRHRVADRVARRDDRGDALLEPARIDPDLERTEPLVAQPQRRFGACRRWQEHPARGIDRQAVGRATEQASRPGARRPGRGCPTAPPRAASTARHGSRSSRGRGRGARSPAGPRRRTGARTPRSRPSCRPSRPRRRPRRSRPGRPWRRTSGAGRGPRRPGTAGPAGR